MNLIPHHQTEFMIKKGTAIDAVKAQGTLELTGAVKDGELINIGTEVFEIDTDQQAGNNHEVIDVSAHAVASQGLLTLNGVLKDGEHFKIGDDTYEIDSDDSYTEGNIPVDVSEYSIPAKGTLELTGVVKDGEKFLVDTETFEIDTDGTVEEGNIAIDVSAHATPAQGSLTLPIQPSIGDTFTIGVGAGEKLYTFVAELDADADGEVGIGADLAGAQANIIAAINGTDAFNTAHTQVTAGTFTDNVLVITAKKPGTFGNTIATTETFSGETNVFDGLVLGTTTSGADCTAANADGEIVSQFNTQSTVPVTASQGAGTTIVFTADVAGDDGNSIATDPETLSNGAFDATTLGTTQAGVDCPAADGDGAIIAAINGNALAPVVASQGTGTTVLLTAKTPGTIGDTIETDPETFANGSFDGTTLGTETAGVDCPAADADGIIISEFNEHTNQGITASQGAGTTIIFESDLGGVIGNAIPSSTDMDNGAFDDTTLGTTQLGVNGSIGQALIDDNFLYVSDEDNSVHGSDWKKIALTDL